MNRCPIVIAAALVASTLVGAHAQDGVAVGFLGPESVYWHPDSQTWFVANLGAAPDPAAKDGDGFISRLDGSGAIVADRWVTGLNTPKGMRAYAGKLYVADVDVIVVIDITAAAIEQTLVLPGASILNDVAVDESSGDLYATDWTGQKIYKVSAGVPSVLVASESLESPNGIIVDGDRLAIAAWGTNINPTLVYTTDEPGRILFVDKQTGAITPMGDERIGGLDGIEKDGEDYLVTDWTGGRLLRVSPDGSVEQLGQLPPSAADLGFDPHSGTIGVPVIFAHTVFFESV